MPSSKKANKPGHITKQDIFDDLGLSPQEALEAKVKSEIWRDLMNHIERKGYNQADLTGVLKIHQPDVSNLMRGKISKFSTDKLIRFAGSLNLGVHVQLTELKPSKRATVSSISAVGTRKRQRDHEPAHA